jgi:hypothetical protein
VQIIDEVEGRLMAKKNPPVVQDDRGSIEPGPEIRCFMEQVVADAIKSGELYPLDTSWVVFEAGGLILGEVQAPLETAALLLARARWQGRKKTMAVMRKERYEKQKRKRERQLERNLLAVAHHEAAHAVVARLTSIPLVRLELRAKIELLGNVDGVGFSYRLGLMKGKQGVINQGDLPRRRRFAEKHAIMALVGQLAEARCQRRRVDLRRSRSGDMEFVRWIVQGLAKAAGWESRSAYLDHLVARANAYLENAWPQVQAVATALAERRKLSRDEVIALMNSATKPGGDPPGAAEGRERPGIARSSRIG